MDKKLIDHGGASHMLYILDTKLIRNLLWVDKTKLIKLNYY